MATIEELQKEIEKLKARNKRVEADKAWETSRERIVFIACISYLLISLVMMIIGVDRPFVSAIIPTTGYLLSTISIGFIKEIWLKKRK